MRKIIGFHGRARTGKDTAAAYLTKHYGFRQASFAGGIKEMFRALMAYRHLSPELVERMVDGDLKDVHSDWLGCSPRHFMQTLGTEWGRQQIGPTFWVATEWDHQTTEVPSSDFVFSDVRFPEEARFILDHGGTVVKLVRPNLEVVTPELANHISEHQKVPYTIEMMNNASIPDLHVKLDRLMDYLNRFERTTEIG